MRVVFESRKVDIPYERFVFKIDDTHLQDKYPYCTVIATPTGDSKDGFEVATYNSFDEAEIMLFEIRNAYADGNKVIVYD